MAGTSDSTFRRGSDLFENQSEEVLQAVFRDAWSDVLDAFRGVEESDESPREQLGHVAAILLRWPISATRPADDGPR